MAVGGGRDGGNRWPVVAVVARLQESWSDSTEEDNTTTTLYKSPSRSPGSKEQMNMDTNCDDQRLLYLDKFNKLRYGSKSKYILLCTSKVWPGLTGYGRCWPGMTGEDEYAKIKAAGGKVIRWDGHHVFGALVIYVIDSEGNTTLRNHITHPHCEVIKAQKNQNPEAGQTSMARYGSVLDFEEDVFDDEGQRNETISLSDEEIALDASSEGTLSPGGPRYDYMMSSEAEDDY
nr:hypothetical protein [Tanacetum cinerariifolium]